MSKAYEIGSDLHLMTPELYKRASDQLFEDKPSKERSQLIHLFAFNNGSHWISSFLHQQCSSKASADIRAIADSRVGNEAIQNIALRKASMKQNGLKSLALLLLFNHRRICQFHKTLFFVIYCTRMIKRSV